MSNESPTAEAVEAELAKIEGESSAPAKKKAPAKRKSGLDKDRSYGTVHGMPGVSYQQDGKLYDGAGNPVK